MPTRVDRARRCGRLAPLAFVATLALAGTAHAAATLTYPPGGATVALDKKANFTFSWTLPPGEVMPSPQVGDSPTYDPDTFAPFGPVCDVLPDTATSCRPDGPIPAGTHYVFVDTVNTDVTQHFESPVTRFVVPPMLALGCGPRAPSCVAPKGFQRVYVPHPPIGLPNSSLEMNAWFNAPDDTPANFTFVIKRRHKVMARLHDVQRSSDLLVDSGFLLLHSQIRWGSHRKHWHGPRGGTVLTVICTMTAEGLSLTRTEKVKAPPA
jgi:hypothetical protein